MSWISSWIWLAGGCGAPGHATRVLEPGNTAEAGPWVTTAPFGDSTDTGRLTSTADTGSLPLPFDPACDPFPVGSCVHLTGDQDGDYAGRKVDVGDVDADGFAEALVSEPALGQVYYVPETGAAWNPVHLLRAPLADGTLASATSVRFDGPPSHFSYWGDSIALVDGTRSVAVADFSTPDLTVKMFDVTALSGVVTSEAHTGGVASPHPYSQFGVPSELRGCGAQLCVTTIENDTDLLIGLAGQVLTYDLPIVGDTPLLPARGRYMGDPFDDARMVEGGCDLDGDGTSDLAIGAFDSLGVGRVAVLLSPPDGEHRIWDVADATLTGTSPGDELGLGLATGDLDGDGAGDVVAGGPLNEGGVYGWRGPHSGDRLTSAADWQVAGDDGRWLGYDLAVGDFDGDDAPDLAIGAPWPLSDAPAAGTVYLFLAPLPGTYTRGDATAALQSGVGAPDAFGISVDVGDLDGDGRDDLVIGAPLDPTAGVDAGAVLVLFGGGL